MLKKLLLIFALSLSIHSHAQIPILDIIRQGVKKVIVAVDLKIQRLQNNAIWLQNAQKTIENTMSKLRLTEISDWAEKQRKLYDDYFQELWKIKSVIAYYHRVKDIIETQIAIVNEYRAAWNLFQQDHHFSKEELAFMSGVYAGMLEECIKNIDQLYIIINAFATQMTDAKRLGLINGAADKIDQVLMDLKQFNNQNKIMSLQRASEKGDIEYVKRLYGL